MNFICPFKVYLHCSYSNSLVDYRGCGNGVLKVFAHSGAGQVNTETTILVKKRDTPECEKSVNPKNILKVYGDLEIFALTAVKRLASKLK